MKTFQGFRRNHVHRTPEAPVRRSSAAADPVTTELVRHSLEGAAREMKDIMVRTSFSPIVYESLDFGVALYDRHVRLLAQAPTSPIFLGTFSFCIEATITAVGGVGELRDGDILLQNQPYHTGAHAQDAALIAPVFLDCELIGFAINKAHWGDIGAKSGYCTDTTDVFQEGVMFPGIRLYAAGELVRDIQRMVLANSRLPDATWGDVCAQVATVLAGAKALRDIVRRFGRDRFAGAVETMFDQGERSVRHFVERLDDGAYRAEGQLDSDGLTDEPVRFPVTVEVRGADLRVDFTEAPDALAGPMNCPLPSTVSGCRVALCMLAAEGQAPNEGHFRALEVATRVGSMFHPVAPAPCYLYGWPIIEAMQAVYRALAGMRPGLVPSGSAGDICAVGGGGIDPFTGQVFVVGSALPVGQGAHARGDGTTVYIPALAQSKLISAELLEAKAPVLFLGWEFLPDSGGAGEFQGGPGWLYRWQALQPMRLTSTVEHTRQGAWGQHGGGDGVANRLTIKYPDGSMHELRKFTDLSIPKGTIVSVHCGGGGGYGPPSGRDPAVVRRDLANGLITPAFAARHYPQAL
jgi:N-methylhydantoinase B